MKTGFSNRMKDVFTFVREEVIRLRHSSIRVEHLFLGILRDGGGSAIMVLKNLDVDPQDLKTIIENTIKTSVVDQNVSSNEISFSKQAERVLKKSILERKNLVEDEIKTIHVLLSILLDDNNIVTTTLKHLHLDYDIILEEYQSLNINISSEDKTHIVKRISTMMIFLDQQVVNHKQKNIHQSQLLQFWIILVEI
jgi:ATP-dependent Clp protease ATP-binding subunit ClpC